MGVICYLSFETSFVNMEATIKSELVEILTEVETMKARLELAKARLEVLATLILRKFVNFMFLYLLSLQLFSLGKFD